MSLTCHCRLKILPRLTAYLHDFPPSPQVLSPGRRERQLGEAGFQRLEERPLRQGPFPGGGPRDLRNHLCHQVFFRIRISIFKIIVLGFRYSPPCEGQSQTNLTTECRIKEGRKVEKSDGLRAVRFNTGPRLSNVQCQGLTPYSFLFKCFFNQSPIVFEPLYFMRQNSCMR